MRESDNFCEFGQIVDAAQKVRQGKRTVRSVGSAAIDCSTIGVISVHAFAGFGSGIARRNANAAACTEAVDPARSIVLVTCNDNEFPGRSEQPL